MPTTWWVDQHKLFGQDLFTDVCILDESQKDQLQFAHKDIICVHEMKYLKT